MEKYFKNRIKNILIVVAFVSLSLIYLFPLLQGLILLPLDLLISNYQPWYSPGTILLKNPYMQDSIIQLFPWKHLVFQSLTQGIIPLWNPYQFLGMPFMASLKPMVFYPLNILFILGEKTAWNTLLYAQIFISLISCYFLAREFKLNLLPSIMASLAFSLNSLMITFLEFGSDAQNIIWWPLLFLFAKRYIDERKGRYIIFLGVVLATSIFAGQLQHTGYVLLALTGFIFFYGRSLKVKRPTYLAIFLTLLLGIGISAIQLIPSIELFSQSHRGLLDQQQTKYVFTRGLIEPHVLFRLLSPDFFGNPVTKDAIINYIETSGYFGIIPLFFCIYALVFEKKKIAVFFKIVFIITILLSLKGVGELLYFLKIPVLTSGEAGRIFSLVLFSGSVLSGFGVDLFLKSKDIKKNLTSLIIFTFFFAAIILIYSFVNIHEPDQVKKFIHNIQFSSIILGVFVFVALIFTFISEKRFASVGKILFLSFVIGLTFFDLFRMGYRFLTFSNDKFLYPELGVTKFIKSSQKDSLARTFGLTEPEFGTYLNIYTIETYNPLYPKRTAILLQALQKQSNKKISEDNKYLLNNGENLKRLLDFLGASIIVSTKDENPSMKYFLTTKYENDLQLIYKDDKHAVYKNLSSYPRFGLYYKKKEIKNDTEALRVISEGSIDFRNTLLLEKNIPISFEQGKGWAKLISSNLNTQQFRVSTNKPAIFYISDTFFPGWKARVNSQPVEIYRANYNFRAVIVPEGKSVIEFTYLPDSFLIGVAISVISAILLLGISFFPFAPFIKSKQDFYKLQNNH